MILLMTLALIGLCFCVFCFGVKAGYWLAQQYMAKRGFLDNP